MLCTCGYGGRAYPDQFLIHVVWWEQRAAVQVSLQSPFPLLGLDHLSHRKFSVQEQIFTHSEACSAGNWPVPRALFPDVGRTHRAPAGARLTCGTGGDGLLDWEPFAIVCN